MALEASSAAQGGQVATTVLVIGEGAALFAAFCPSWFTVRSPFFHDQAAKAGNVNAIRQGEVAGAVITVAVGAAGSAMVRSPLPLAGAVLVSIVMVVGYEWSIAHPSSEHSERNANPVARALSFRAAQ